MAVRDRKELHRERIVHTVPLAQGKLREVEPAFLDHQTPGTVLRQIPRHLRAAVTWRRRGRQSLTPEERQPQIMPDVGVREKDAVERATGLGPLPERLTRDEIHLARQIGRRVHEIEALDIRFDERQRCNVAWPASRSLTARRVAPGLRQPAILHRPQNQRIELGCRDPSPPTGSRSQRREQEVPTGDGGHSSSRAKGQATKMSCRCRPVKRSRRPPERSYATGKPGVMLRLDHGEKAALRHDRRWIRLHCAG